MFTGIITEIGKVKSLVRKGSTSRLEVECSKMGENLNIGDSVAVNGVCLSITKKTKGLIFDVVGNTFSNTNLKRLKPGNKVNLESALRMGDTLSGHIVSGHIDGERTIKKNQKTSSGWVLDIGMLPGDEKHLVNKGSVALDGVSLTVGEVSNKFFRIFLIPHTLGNTTIETRRIGDMVNVEFDVIGKYADKRSGARGITNETLRDNGFI